MRGNCEWCDKEDVELVRYEHMEIGGIYDICKECAVSADEGNCITCGDPLYGEASLNWECIGCQQIKEAKVEKRRSEVLNGLGLDTLAELTHSVEFTEEDYERWVTFGQGNFTPEKRKQYRRNWIRKKLAREYGWCQKQFDENFEDVEWLLDNYSHRIFSQSCIFSIVDGSKENARKLRGMNIIARKGKIVVVDSEYK